MKLAALPVVIGLVLASLGVAVGLPVLYAGLGLLAVLVLVAVVQGSRGGHEHDGPREL